MATGYECQYVEDRICLWGKRDTTRENEEEFPEEIRSDKKIRIADQRPLNKKSPSKKSGTFEKIKVQRS